jgi:hypothetical protein
MASKRAAEAFVFGIARVAEGATSDIAGNTRIYYLTISSFIKSFTKCATENEI